MALQFKDIENTLQDTRDTLLAAASGDGMVSRVDFEALLEQTADPLQRNFIDFFYEFLIKLEDRPRMRVTEDIIDKGIAFIQQQLIPTFEVKTNFTLATKQQIAEISDLALPVTEELLKITAANVLISPHEVYEQIGQYTGELFFDDLGSEAGIQIEPFFLEYSGTTISPRAFVEALGIDPDIPVGEVSRFIDAEEILYRFIDKSGPELEEKARSVVELMRENLNDLKVIVLGSEFTPEYESNHPVYVVGLGQSGNIAGFTSFVVWT